MYYRKDQLRQINMTMQQKLEQMEEKAKFDEERQRKKELKRQRKEMKRQMREQQKNDKDQAPISDDEEDESSESENENELQMDYEREMYEDKRVLPSIHHPKLWQVNVKKGQERVATMALMNKQVYYTRNGKPLSILSAIHIPNVENCIFVEAYKLESVREAIEGLNFCYHKINQLPLEEMTKIFDNQTELDLPVEGQWVRIKNGMYQNDLGIIDTIPYDDKYYVKMVPRYDPLSLRPGYNRKTMNYPISHRFP